MTSVENTSSSQPKKSQLEEFDVVILGGRTSRPLLHGHSPQKESALRGP
jgi:hypothetical protein